MTRIKTIFLAACAALAAFPLAPAAQEDLRCELLKGRVRAVKVMYMSPIRREKTWLPGTAHSAFETWCAMDGARTATAEYAKNALSQKAAYEHRDAEASKTLCLELRSQFRQSTSFSETGKTSLDDFCRRFAKKTFTSAVLRDVTRPEDPGLIKQVFTVPDGDGRPGETYYFDPSSGLEERRVWKYGKDGKPSELRVFDGREELLQRETWLAAADPASETHSTFGPGGQLQKRTVTEYRADGSVSRVTDSAFDEGEQEISRSETYFTPAGDKEKELAYRGEMDSPAYEYLFGVKKDGFGNWIEERRIKMTPVYGKKIIDAKDPPRIILRQIEYYDPPPGRKTESGKRKE